MTCTISFHSSNPSFNFEDMLIAPYELYYDTCCFRWYLKCSNCLYPRMCHTSSLISIYDGFCFSFFIIFAVPKCIACDVCIACDIVIMNGISFMYTAIVTCLFCSRSPLGRSLLVLITALDRVFLVVLTFRDPSFGPKISSFHRMSAFVIGKSVSMLFCTFLMY